MKTIFGFSLIAATVVVSLGYEIAGKSADIHAVVAVAALAVGLIVIGQADRIIAAVNQ
jgi:hypothetical protein